MSVTFGDDRPLSLRCSYHDVHLDQVLRIEERRTYQIQSEGITDGQRKIQTLAKLIHSLEV